jgi:hypothetical protein
MSTEKELEATKSESVKFQGPHDPHQLLVGAEKDASSIKEILAASTSILTDIKDSHDKIGATLLEGQDKLAGIATITEEATQAKRQILENIVKPAQIGAETIAQHLETVKAVSQTVSNEMKQISDTLSDSRQKHTEILAVATQALAAQTSINDQQAIIATKSDHIQKAQEHADNVRGQLDRTLTSAKQQATEAEGEKTRAKSIANSISELQNTINSVKTTVEKDSEAISKSREIAEKATNDTSRLSEKSTEIESRIADYEKKLEGFTNSYAEQLASIEKLLPGATAAGLAHAFDERRKSFIKPHNRWQKLFIGSVLVIIIVAAFGLFKTLFAGTPLTFKQLAEMWISRLPIVGALVWLAMHASREAALAKRLEEDYGYKAAIATSFLGFHKQMETIGTNTANNEPLAKLCGDTLSTIATPPGRIYDNHKLTVSPTDEIVKTAKVIADVAKVPGLGNP